MRLLTIIGVISVHSVSNLLPTTSVATGAALTYLHLTREVFLLLTGFVLAYRSRGRTPAASSFWRRRYPLVLAPYAMWTAIYLFEGGTPGGILPTTGRYFADLADGGAKYHLYFLLLTLQLYLVFPWLLKVIVAHLDRWRVIVAASVAWQLLFTAAIHYRWSLPQPIRVWQQHPGSWLPSYIPYVIGGILLGLRHDQIMDWVRTHRRAVTVAMGVAFGLAGLSYWADISMLHMAPIRAGEVFQPAVVLDSAAVLGAQLALGSWVEQRWSARRLAVLERGSDVSFGVYLAHPLLLDGLIAAGSATGWAAATERWPVAVTLPLVLVMAPVIAVVTAFAVDGVRRTPLSLVLTGRRVRTRSVIEVDQARAVPAAPAPGFEPAGTP